MVHLDRRSTQDEEMDAATTDPQTYATCLRDLSAVNRVTSTHRPTLRWLHDATAHAPRDRTISILDIACGHGDLLRAIARWAAGRGLSVRLEGLDLNPRASEIARAATPPAMPIRYRTGNVFAFQPDPPPDLIVSSQFAHHLTDDEIVLFLSWLDRTARQGWFIADLHRHALAYYGFPLLAWAARWHPIVRRDGQISIARSFRRADWVRLLARADLRARIAWRLPFRYCVGALK